MTTHKDRPHHIDCQSKYFSETPEFPGQRLRCTCGEGTRDVYCAWSSDFAGLQGIATFFARLQTAVAARHYYDGWNYRELPDKEYPLVDIEDALYASPVTPAAQTVAYPVAYPDSDCERHRNVTSSHPVCIICMGDEIDRLKAAQTAAVPVPDAYQKALDAALSFIGDVAPGASWWDDVWPEHDAALLAAQQQNDK